MRGRGHPNTEAPLRKPNTRERAPNPAPKNVHEQMIEATLQFVVWKSQEEGNNFAIARVADKTNGQTAIVKGDLGDQALGSELRLKGEWDYDFKQGWQFVAKELDLSTPVDRSAVEAWVTEKGITLDEVEIATIAHHWGDKAVENLENNPYDLTTLGFDFYTADTLAASMNYPLDSPNRIQSGARYLLEENELEHGNTYMSTKDLGIRLKGILGKDYVPKNYTKQLAAKGITLDGTRVYRTEMYDLEQATAALAKEMIARPIRNVTREDVMPPIEKDGFQLTDEQQDAIYNAHKYPLSIITGGPGVGKTATLNKLVESLELSGQTYKLASPTGKASKKVTEATGRDAATLHSTLGWKYIAGIDDNPGDLEDLDVLIVDETSMADLNMMQKLMGRIGPNTRLVLVGDVDQLPPVGVGSPFHDFIASQKVPTTRLTKTFRQGAGSHLLANAQRVRDGKIPLWDKASAEKELGYKVLDDFEYHHEKSSAKTAKAVIKYALENDDTLVISPTRHGRCGVHRLNKDFQKEINPKGESALETEEYKMKIGDRILVNTNMKMNKVKIVNGDLGYISAAYDNLIELQIDGREEPITVPLHKAEKVLELGYVLTIHKSQGSQASQVVCPLEEGKAEHMLSRNLIYTAWTRGQTKCVVIGPESAVEKALNISSTERNTGLTELLRAA